MSAPTPSIAALTAVSWSAIGHLRGLCSPHCGPAPHRQARPAHQVPTGRAGRRWIWRAEPSAALRSSALEAGEKRPGLTQVVSDVGYALQPDPDTGVTPTHDSRPIRRAAPPAPRTRTGTTAAGVAAATTGAPGTRPPQSRRHRADLGRVHRCAGPRCRRRDHAQHHHGARLRHPSDYPIGRATASRCGKAVARPGRSSWPRGRS